MMASIRKKSEHEKQPAAAQSMNLDEQTRIAAQRIFEERQARNLPGDELSDWLAAEAEVKKKR